nr:MAG: ORF1 [TTV-like mini virus]
MPWRNFYTRRRWRTRFRYRPWRSRRFIRRRWKRRPRRYPVRKLKKLKLIQWQPRCIRKCKIIGHMPLLALTDKRHGHNYDLYEFSLVPPKIPSGGDFSIKNFTLNTLFSEHQYCRNKWTRTNTDLPLCRFLGCKFIFYQAQRMDYIVTYDIQLPLRSNLDMYQTMQPSMHGLLQNKLIIPSRETYPKKRPYYKLKIRPPTQLQNKWYFQQDLCKTPLVQIRTSATSLQQFYQPLNSESNNITITFLSTVIQNRNIQKYPKTTGYSNRTHEGQKVYLYTCTESGPYIKFKLKKLIFLGQTKVARLGEEVEKYPLSTTAKYDEDKWGNPFYWEILKGSYPILQSKMTVSTLQTKATTEETIESVQGTYSFSLVQLTDEIRYNPMRDWGNNNKIYIYPLFQEGEGWDPPTDALYSQTISTNLPLWLLTFGYTDFMQRAHSFQRFDTDYIVVIQTTYDRNLTKNLVLISQSLIEGTSPNEDELNPLDEDRWYPCLQFQLEMLNEIIKCGPGTIKIPPDQTYQCQTKYTFYWKWGGNLPPMSSIQDPVHQPTYPIPNNVGQTIALQNPESNPEHILYNFDERRGMLTTKAIKRILKDEGFTKPFITDPESGHIPPVQTTSKETPEESSEEEETTQTLLDQLIKQRRKQQQLKQLILQHMKLTSLE